MAIRFQVVYASALNGWASLDAEQADDMTLYSKQLLIKFTTERQR